MPVTVPYYDASKLAAALKAQGAGADGRTVLTGQNLLSILNPVNAPTYNAASTRLETHGQDDPTTETDPAYYQDSYGNKLSPVDGAQFGDPSGQYFQNSLENPSSTGGKDQAMVTYKIQPDGTAVPVAATNQYAPSQWVDYGRLATELGAVVGTAGLAGAGLAGAGAGTVGGGTEGLSGMDLAADAAAGTGNNIATAGSGLGSLGGDVATAAPAYGGPGTSGAGAGTDAIVNGSSATGGLSSLPSLGQVLNGAKAVGTIGSLLGAGGGGGSTSAPSVATSTAAPSTQGALGIPASVYSYTGYQGTPAPSRPGHTMGPSIAVNLNDPASAMFGDGKVPTYYQKPMADGGSVDDNGDPYGGSYDPTAGGMPVTDDPTVATPQGMADQLKDWWSRYTLGDKKAQNQALMALTAVGGLSSLFGKKTRPLSAGELANTLKQNGGGMNAVQAGRMSDYFNAPAGHYVAPVVHVNPTYGAPPQTNSPGVLSVGQGGLSALPGYARGGSFDPAQHGPYVPGNGQGGQSDKVDASLSPGEYVVDADVVSSLGDGSNEAGARSLDQMREAIRTHKRSAPPSQIPPPALSALQYLRKGK